ncbi:MAG TPA: AI-2E family transporter [Polyangia bacterium]|jgi:predicted PurR-regulated permease PerM|nr:AI-2E family transporter [Polyangia bacterium]
MPEHEAGHGGADRTAVVHRIEISYRTVMAVALTVGGIWLLNLLLPILVVIVVALILVGTLRPSVAWLRRHRVNRVVAIAIVFVGCGVVVLAAGLITIPALFAQVSQTINNLPDIQKSLARTLESHHLTAPLANAIRTFKPEDRVRGLNMTTALTASLDVFEVIGYAATSVVLAIYFIADADRTRGALYALFPRRFHVRLARVLLNLETIVGGYLRGQIVTSVAIGIFTFALLEIARVPNALALGAFAALTDVIPFVGGLLATTPAVLVALSRGTAVATIVLFSMIGYQEFESRVIVPRVYGQALRLSSAVVVIALLVGGKVGGIIGALLALPIAAALRMLIEELRVDLPGDDTDDPRTRARDARAERVYAREAAGASPQEAAAVATEIANEIRQADVAAGKDPTQAQLTPEKK